MPDGSPFFPEVQRVVYRKSPIKQVVCQLRFPRLLKIESGVPADFQEQIRHVFPLFDRGIDTSVQNLPTEVIQMLGAVGNTAHYVFRTEDNFLQTVLAPDNISLTSQSYLGWEHFSERLLLILAAFKDIYKPSFFSRIGLRYSNIFDKNDLGLPDVPWSELLNSDILGELAVSRIEACAIDAKRAIRIKMPADEGSLLFQHGISSHSGRPDPSGYFVDFDFYTDERTGAETANEIVERFHTNARGAFRWSISDRLHEQLGPSS